MKFVDLIDHGKIPALWGMLIATICVLGIIFCVPLHIESLTGQLSTIAELSVPTASLTSVGHHYIQSKNGGSNGSA